jgi:hypothetical protein
MGTSVRVSRTARGAYANPALPRREESGRTAGEGISTCRRNRGEEVASVNVSLVRSQAQLQVRRAKPNARRNGSRLAAAQRVHPLCARQHTPFDERLEHRLATEGVQSPQGLHLRQVQAEARHLHEFSTHPAQELASTVTQIGQAHYANSVDHTPEAPGDQGPWSWSTERSHYARVGIRWQISTAEDDENPAHNFVIQERHRHHPR